MRCISSSGHLCRSFNRKILSVALLRLRFCSIRNDKSVPNLSAKLEISVYSKSLKKSVAGAIRKPGSVPVHGYPWTGDDHSSRTAVADGLKQPTRKHGRATLDASLFGLAPGGVYLASGVAVGPGELLPHPFTLTCLCRGFGRRTSLCGTIPGVAPAGRYPAPCPAEPGLSSP